MSKNPMMDSGFDPYNALVELNERLLRLEQAHNMLANDYMKSQRDLDITMNSLNSLQKGHLHLSQLVGVAAISKYDIKK
jgi:hypothetical protein